MSYFRELYDSSPGELPHRARNVYMYLSDRAGKGEDCWPAVKTIAFRPAAFPQYRQTRPERSCESRISGKGSTIP